MLAYDVWIPNYTLDHDPAYLENLITEFDCDKEVRYSGYISGMLHLFENKDTAF